MEVNQVKTIQKGLWRRGKDGKFKPFIRGCAQLDGTVVEVESRDGNRTYVESQGLTKGLGMAIYMSLSIPTDRNLVQGCQRAFMILTSLKLILILKKC